VRKLVGLTETSSPDWAAVYAELRNKIRWAIGSTAGESGAVSLGFQEQMALAGPLAGEVTEAFKSLYEKPNLRLVQDSPETKTG